jgi:hypothetical protein
MTDLVHTLLSRRALLPPCAVLDCLDLADWLGPRIRAGLTPHVTTADLENRWSCTQSTASRRVSALMEHGLIEATLQAGPGTYWAVKRVGPVA